MKQLLILLFIIFVFADDQCPQQLQNQCVDVITKAYDICGRGIGVPPPSLPCLKYFNLMSTECWPCICPIADQNKWIVTGCSDKLKKGRIMID